MKPLLLLLALTVWAGAGFAMGEVHGRFEAEQGIGDALLDCQRHLRMSEMGENACDRALLECSDGGRFTQR